MEHGDSAPVPRPDAVDGKCQPALPAAHSSQHDGPPQFTDDDRRTLLRLARHAVTVAVSGQSPETVDASGFSHRMLELRATFVTLTQGGKLRGCIGNLVAREAVYSSVMNNARGAALRDMRFAPVEVPELPTLEFKVSVLSDLQPLRCTSPQALLENIVAGRDGVVLQVQGHTSTFLPQVWEQFPDKKTFMETLARKAGLLPSAWEQPDAEVKTYQVESFGEQSPD